MKKISHKKTGILGGTFNPVHCGHIHLARKALEEAKLDQILFIPSGVSYMKNLNEILPTQERLEMVRLAVRQYPAFAVSSIETDKKGNSYSHETIQALQNEQPETEFFFLTGADTIFSMEEWKDPASIFQSVTILAACRPGISLEGLQKQISYLQTKYRADIRLIAVDYVDISSSDIREAIRNGISIHGLVPQAVENYISEHHLYQNTQER